MAKREKPPAPIIRRTLRGFSLASAWDAERVSADAIGTEYNLVKRSRRSNPQSNLYWKALAGVVAATGRWATSAHLHEDIKLTLGYVRKSTNLRTGEVSVTADSTAFDEMEPDVYKVFFDEAMALLAEQCGFDPLHFYSDRASA